MILADSAEMAILFIGMGLGLLCLLFALHADRRRRRMQDTPTSKTTGVFAGFVEVKGTAESEAPLRSYLAEIPCVVYDWQILERWSRTRTEHYTDSNGKRRTRTKHESGWTTVAEGADRRRFYLRDDEGIIRVDPDGARVHDEEVFDQRCHRSDALYYGKGPDRAVSDSDHVRRFVERAIPLHTTLYVLGGARCRNDVVAPEIAASDAAPTFLISTRSEEQLVSRLRGQFWGLGILGVVLACAGSLWGMRRGNDEPFVFAAIAGGGTILVWLLGWAWLAYNSLVDLRHRVEQGWANVDVQLKRRADLIPNLVRAVEGIRQHEADVQETLALLRSQAHVTAPGQEGADAQGLAGRLVALAEAYPELTANANFLKLQESLSDTEQRIALARGYYNEIVAYNNTRRRVFPDSLLAGLAGLEEKAYITAADFERARVDVHLTDEPEKES